MMMGLVEPMWCKFQTKEHTPFKEDGKFFLTLFTCDKPRHYARKYLNAN
jgi:hypothetical protein